MAFARPSPGEAGAKGLCAVIAARYETSPVGPYLELALGRPTVKGARPGLSVTAMVVDSAVSEAAGRHHWGFPKQLGTISWSAEGRSRRLAWDDGGVRVSASAANGPGLPVWVPIRAFQHRGEDEIVPGRLRARARPARVTVESVPESVFHGVQGRWWGLLLSDLRLVIGPPFAAATTRT